MFSWFLSMAFYFQRFSGKQLVNDWVDIKAVLTVLLDNINAEVPAFLISFSSRCGPWQSFIWVRQLRIISHSKMLSLKILAVTLKLSWQSCLTKCVDGISVFSCACEHGFEEIQSTLSRLRCTDGCVVQELFSMCSVWMSNFLVQCSFILLCSWTLSQFSSHGILLSWQFYLFVQVVASHVRREGRVGNKNSACYCSADFFPWHFIFKDFPASNLLTIGLTLKLSWQSCLTISTLKSQLF